MMNNNMTTIPIHLVDAFTKENNKGNRAGVVLDASDLAPQQMQKIAAFAGVSETAFILPSSDPNAYDLQVRYFTPTVEVPICGHATIATHYLRAVKNNITHAQLLAKTGAGILPITIQQANGDTKIMMTQAAPKLGAILSDTQKEKLINALNIAEQDLIDQLPIQIVSTGHSKVMVPLKNQNTLHSIQPHFDELKSLSQEIGSNGFYLFTIESDQSPYKTHGRMFAPAIGINEDPVTGNANGPAGFYLAHYGVLDFKHQYSYHAIQGEAMKKPGVIEVLLEKENNQVTKVKIAGFAVESETLEYRMDR